MFGNFINIVSRKGDETRGASPVHLVNDDSKPIPVPVEDRGSGRRVFNDKVFAWFLNHCIDPAFSEG